MERKKTSLLIIGICALALSVIGMTYAFWTLSLKQTGEDKLLSSCFEVSLINEGTAIHLEKAFPILDSDGEALDPYTFTITNTCSTYAGYQINLESLGKTNTDNRLNPNYLKVKINEKDNEGIISKLGENDKVKETLSDAYESHKLMTGYLGSNESRNFELRLWLDGDLTMADTDVMNKTFASKITVTASYLAEEKVPPTIDLELAVCDNTITAKGKGTANGGKEITKYEFKLDDNENWQTFENEDTTEFTVSEEGEYTVSLKVTDSKGITSEVTKTIDTTSKKVNIYGRDIPITTCNNGLYEVEHEEYTTDQIDGFKNTEYRYAGETPNNYVWFNCTAGSNSGETDCEKWRIIGLVNVKTSSGIQQRLKIIKAESIGDYSWDYKPIGQGSSINEEGSNDWTDSQLMEVLNDDYYQNIGKFAPSENSNTKGLKESAKDMIDKDVIWNLGESSNANNATVSMFYEEERGIQTYKNDALPFLRETEWQASNTGRASKEITKEKVLDDTLFRSIALPYPSDYGYATSGGTLGREECFSHEMYNWDDYIECYNNNWLKPINGYMWTLTSYSSHPIYAFLVYSNGYLRNCSVNISCGVYPTLYLSKSVQIVDNGNDGSYEKPYTLTM